MTPPGPESAISVFFCYAHEDEPLRDKLAKHLTLLERQGVIQPWHDRQILAGSDWQGELDQHIETAQVILLLISADFLASDYCYDLEMTRALERQRTGSAQVIPILLRPVDNWSQSPFGGLQALPTDGKPVTRWADEDEAFADVARGIRLAAQPWSRRERGSVSLRGRDHALSPRATPLEAGDRGRLPELFTYDLDRGQQEFELSQTLERLGPLSPRPVLCFLHGDQRECHDKFIQCLEKASLRRLLRLKPTQAPYRYLITKWPSQLDELNNFQKRYCMHLGAKILDDNQADPQRINDWLASIPAPVIIETEFFTRSWKRHAAKVVIQVLEFWRRWPELAPNQVLLVCLSIKYPSPQRSLLSTVCGRKSIREEVAAALAAWSLPPDDRVMLAALSPLRGVTQQDAEAWVHDNERDLIRRYGEAAVDELNDTIHTMFEQCPSPEEPKRLPMEAVARQLRNLLPAHRMQWEASIR